MVVNYIFLWISLLALLSLLEEYDPSVLLGVVIFLFIIVPNLIYIHINKPVDLEKESLKKELEELKKR